MDNKYAFKVYEDRALIIDNGSGYSIGLINTPKSGQWSIVKIPRYRSTPEFIDWLIENAPDSRLFFCITYTLMTDEQRKKCYERLDVDDKARFIIKGYMSNLITRDNLNEILNNYNNEHSYLVSVFTGVLKNIDKEIVDQRAAEKILSIENCKYINFIPEKYLNYDVCKRAVEFDWHLIEFVPIKYQTIEIQKLALNKSYKAIFTIPDEALSDEIMRYALSLDVLALEGIPEDKRTEEYCNIAFLKTPKVFAWIPDKYKSYDMCIKTLLEFPKLITKVPAHILNEQFLDEIKSLHIVIPTAAMGYVNECIRINSKMDEPVNLEEIPKIQPVQLPNEIANITIDSLSPYFSPGSLAYFKKNNIETFEQLCNMVNNLGILNDIKNNYIRSEITVTTKLLKCKHLNEDPLININDDECISGKTLEKFGFSTRAIRHFYNVCSDKTPMELLNMLGTDDFDDLFHRTHEIGKKTVNEITLKLSIIKDYYDSVEKNATKETEVENGDKNMNLADELESLLLEYHRLVEERERIDALTAAVLSKIQEKTMIQSKGGVRK